MCNAQAHRMARAGRRGRVETQPSRRLTGAHLPWKMRTRQPRGASYGGRIITERYQALMIGHGAIVMFFGLISGFFFAFNLVGEITLWPIPGTFDVHIPGDPERWRAAHTGNITNALMIIAAGLCLPRLQLSRGAERFVAWGLILTVWGNLGFYFISAFGAPGRGLTMGANKFGGGDFWSQLNFLIAYPGAFIAPVALLLIARGAFLAARKPR
jgi:hypothetical protein